MERHLAVHLDVNMTVTAFDSKMGYSPAVVLNRHLVSTTWLAAEHTQGTAAQRDADAGTDHALLAESGFRFLSDKPSVDPPAVPPHMDPRTVGSFHDFMSLFAPVRSPTVFGTRPRGEWRDHYTHTDSPGARFRPHFAALHHALLWPQETEADPDFTFQPHIHNHSHSHSHSHSHNQQCYHFLLPSFCSFFLDIIRSPRSFTIVLRTFGHDGQRVLRCLARLANGEHPLFPLRPGDETAPLAFIPFAFHLRHERGGSVALDYAPNEPSLIPKHLLGRFCPESVVSEARKCRTLQALQRMPRTVAVVLDDYSHWNRRGGKQVGGKPLFVDETDDTVHPLLFDDHIWFDPEDSIADLRIRNPQSGLYESVHDQIPYRNMYLVRAALIESVTQPDYYMANIARCEERRKERDTRK